MRNHVTASNRDCACLIHNFDLAMAKFLMPMYGEKQQWFFLHHVMYIKSLSRRVHILTLLIIFPRRRREILTREKHLENLIWLVNLSSFCKMILALWWPGTIFAIFSTFWQRENHFREYLNTFDRSMVSAEMFVWLHLIELSHYWLVW